MTNQSLPLKTPHNELPFSASNTLIHYAEVWTIDSEQKQLDLSAACRLGRKQESITITGLETDQRRL